MTNLTHGDCIAIDGRLFTIGTTVGYAMEYARNDIVSVIARAVARAAASGSALVWANPQATVLSSRPTERDMPKVSIRLSESTERGAAPQIMVDGSGFFVRPARNGNVKLEGI